MTAIQKEREGRNELFYHAALNLYLCNNDPLLGFQIRDLHRHPVIEQIIKFYGQLGVLLLTILIEVSEAISESSLSQTLDINSYCSPDISSKVF